MLFNSYEFILAFLPVTVLGFWLFNMKSGAWPFAWLIGASIFFYAWWRPFNLLIIGPSLIVNYFIARSLLSLSNREGRETLRSFVLVLGILFNVCFLGFFKYVNFGLAVTNDIAGTHFVFQQIILPLGISFITFQKIAFLVDVAGGRVRSFTASDFLLFVMFFPQLIAGPIVHYGETMPQFHRADRRVDKNMFATGITLFCFGLFKKVVLADGMAEYVSPIFTFAETGHPLSLLQGWFAAVGFTLQIYFDFSGYSDMACGAALFFGVRLPLNFDSPLKASNIIDFWLRWHITLTRFLTAYIYNPIALALTRRRAAKGLSMLKAHGSTMYAFFSVLAWPTLATMLLSGVWHGAGYTFILWGLLHGLYLIVNHAWRQYGPQSERGKDLKIPATTVGFALTFVAVVFAMVLFRAPNVATAINVMKGMVGLHGITLPLKLAQLVHLPSLPPMMLLSGAVNLKEFLVAVAYLCGLLTIALFLPNSLQVLSKYQPVLQTPKRPPMIALFMPASQPLLQTPPKLGGFSFAIYWHPTLFWMIFVAALAVISMMRIAGPSEFLYWQF
jgi:D-alanyl-lipoteichoic acid acyltransferase DltB (MBOAT superfamily)